MSVRILHDASDDRACLYDSVSDVAFGPVVGGYEDTYPDLGAGEFLELFLDDRGDGPPDLRQISEAEVIAAVDEFRRRISPEGVS
jgi:hypothetical protein